MNLSFSKEIAEGDIIVISLYSFYINVQQLPTSDNLGQVESEVPLMRKRDGESVQSYRNKLFKMLFERFSQSSNDKWKDREVIIENVDSGNLFAHLIYRDRHKSIIDALVSEILDDSEIILSQK